MTELAFLSTEIENDDDGCSENSHDSRRFVSKYEPDANSKKRTGCDEENLRQETVEICQSTVNPDNKVNCENFKIQKVIGKGGYGKVFLVQKVDGCDEGKLYAMKVLKKARLVCNEKDKAHTVSERNILQMLRHPFLVKLHYAFQNMSNLYIVLEYCPGGELFNYLEREGALLENAACFYAAEIILAIGHLHNLGIIYRDLKSENVLLDRQGHVKLTDFGLSKEGVGTTNTFCGTIEYMAPEIIRCEGHGKAVDWWSLGTLIFDMLSGGPPFSQEETREATTHKILTAPLRFPPSFSSEVISLLRGLLKRDPHERLGGKEDAEEIKRHKFFRKYDVNWSDVYNRRLKPPFRPKLSSENDVSMFSPNFTRLQPVVTPADNTRSIPADMFQGFSYVAPTVCEDAIRDSWTDQPSTRSRRQCGSKSGLSAGRLRRVGDSKPLNGIHEKALDRDSKFPGLINVNSSSHVTQPSAIQIHETVPILTSVANNTTDSYCSNQYSNGRICQAKQLRNHNHHGDESADEPDVDEEEEEVEEENVPGAKHIHSVPAHYLRTMFNTCTVANNHATTFNNSHSKCTFAERFPTGRSEPTNFIRVVPAYPRFTNHNYQNKILRPTLVPSPLIAQYSGQKSVSNYHIQRFAPANTVTTTTTIVQSNLSSSASTTTTTATNSKCILM